MKIALKELTESSFQIGECLSPQLKSVLTEYLPELESSFVQDLSHISTAANYTGEMMIDNIVFLKDNLFRCDYSYNWAIGWTCSGVQEAGRVSEKVRFTLNEQGVVTFKFLKLEH